MALAFSRASARLTLPVPSLRPSENARPALVVESARNPRPVRMRALPASHGLPTASGSVDWWRARNRAARSACVGMNSPSRFRSESLAARAQLGRGTLASENLLTMPVKRKHHKGGDSNGHDHGQHDEAVNQGKVRPTYRCLLVLLSFGRGAIGLIHI